MTGQIITKGEKISGPVNFEIETSAFINSFVIQMKTKTVI